MPRAPRGVTSTAGAAVYARKFPICPKATTKKVRISEIYRMEPHETKINTFTPINMSGIQIKLNLWSQHTPIS